MEEELVVAVALDHHRDVLRRHVRAQLVRERRVGREGRLRHSLRSGVVQGEAGKTEGLLVVLALFRVELE